MAWFEVSQKDAKLFAFPAERVLRQNHTILGQLYHYFTIVNIACKNKTHVGSLI